MTVDLSEAQVCVCVGTVVILSVRDILEQAPFFSSKFKTAANSVTSGNLFGGALGAIS